MSDLESSELSIEPIQLRDAKPALRRSRSSSDMTALWGALLLVGATLGGYAVMRTMRDEPVPPPAPTVTSAPSPAPPARSAPGVRRPRVATTAPTPAAAPTKAAPAVVHHVEPEKKRVDPIEGFDSGEAFDNPPSPGRYGQRTSGLLERGNNPTTAPARPNVPDPSFGRTPR